jgi:formylglycine-generating enzyme required for sulfatase activity
MAPRSKGKDYSIGARLCPLVLAGCAPTGEPRAQLVVAVDTDAPAAGQLEADADLAADAAVDTLRVDVLGPDGLGREAREIVAPDARDWPVSFGVATPEDGGAARVRLRLRAFRAALATPVAGGGPLEPMREAAIDRLVDLELPSEGVAHVHVTLSFECFGAPVSFLTPATTCIDASRLAVPPDGGLPGAPTVARLGTAPRARATPCAGAAPRPATVCVPGGFTLLGERSLAGIEDFALSEPLPLRPVVVAPFWLDATELTVGRYRALVATGSVREAAPTLRDPSDQLERFCTWLGPDDPKNDTLPLNCVVTAAAEEACVLSGGALPTEARWEHAARGRGQRRRFPWGDAAPACCALSAGRHTGPCARLAGVEPVGAHPAAPGCPAADTSRDGLVDLGGSLNELVADDFAPYDAPCWAWRGIAFEPRCVEPGQRGARGGNWQGSLVQSQGALRYFAQFGPALGVRCAYEDAP